MVIHQIKSLTFFPPCIAMINMAIQVNLCFIWPENTPKSIANFWLLLLAFLCFHGVGDSFVHDSLLVEPCGPKFAHPLEVVSASLLNEAVTVWSQEFYICIQLCGQMLVVPSVAWNWTYISEVVAVLLGFSHGNKGTNTRSLNVGPFIAFFLTIGQSEVSKNHYIQIDCILKTV